MKYRNAYMTKTGDFKLGPEYDRIYKAVSNRSRKDTWLGVLRFQLGKTPQRMTIVDYIVEWWND